MPRAASSVGVGRRLPTPTLLVARGIAAGTSSSHTYVFCVFSRGFSRNRETARSLNKLMIITTIIYMTKLLDGWPGAYYLITERGR